MPAPGSVHAKVPVARSVLTTLPTPAGDDPSGSALFLRRLGARTAFLLLVVAGLNLVADPLGVHGSHVFRPIVARTVGEKVYLYERVQPAPPIVVLGSSRSFFMEPRYIHQKTGRPAFNASLAGAGTRDYLNFAQCFAARGTFPSLLIVALGVEQALSDFSTMEQSDAMDDCLHPRRTIADRADAYKGLFTRQETWASLRLLALEVAGRPAPTQSFDRDGMMRQSLTAPARSVEEGVTESLATAWGPRVFSTEELSARSLDHVRGILDLCRRHGTSAIVYLPPYHPRAVALYERESRYAAARDRLKAQLAEWAAEYPLRVHDFTDVARFGGRAEMFVDASHPTVEADRLMLDVMLADPN